MQKYIIKKDTHVIEPRIPLPQTPILITQLREMDVLIWIYSQSAQMRSDSEDQIVKSFKFLLHLNIGCTEYQNLKLINE
jgi:hypothetical protein